MKVADVLTEPHRRTLDQKVVGRLIQAYRDGGRVLAPAVAIAPGRGFVLALGEHRFAARALGGEALGATVDVYVLRAWEDVVAWMMVDQTTAVGGQESTGWDYVTAAHLTGKLINLVKSSRTDMPQRDVAEYVGLNESALSNTRWAIAREADPTTPDAMRLWLRNDLRDVRRGLSSAHSIRTRYKGHESRLRAEYADPARQAETIRRALIQLKAASEAIEALGVLASNFDGKEALALRDEIVKAHRPIIRLNAQLKERASGS